ncbi:helix-turn-helix domain-containing protein [Brevundimonas sp.]|uniref:helix-turn-helix domain-containing protein n=1 Tax=Brevundimonas sp. TaxID=1871086 RepID=UPI002ABB6134|nr:helix-turn-helix domain-containing protein [Brevundimonas sp.]MDZ4059786.1 helix-turn-helix domain-containing protein [Brevundimonas sp.]HWQ85202.1 helix-turn-helix domain-containing protein [Brevundimonas sp.]
MSSFVRSPKQLGSLIQQSRKMRGWSQTDLAQRAGLRQEMVSKIEAGQPGSRVASIFDLLAALDLEMTLAPRTKSSAADIEDIF